MSQRPFFNQLFLLTLTVTLILLGLQFGTTMQQEMLFSWISLLFFTIFSIIIHFLANWAVHSKNKYTFLNVVLGMTSVKMLLCVIIALIYKLTTAVPSKNMFKNR